MRDEDVGCETTRDNPHYACTQVFEKDSFETLLSLIAHLRKTCHGRIQPQAVIIHVQPLEVLPFISTHMSNAEFEFRVIVEDLLDFISSAKQMRVAAEMRTLGATAGMHQVHEQGQPRHVDLSPHRIREAHPVAVVLRVHPRGQEGLIEAGLTLVSRPEEPQRRVWEAVQGVRPRGEGEGVEAVVQAEVLEHDAVLSGGEGSAGEVQRTPIPESRDVID